jgi:cytochrome c-type biogenesis protein CcmE
MTRKRRRLYAVMACGIGLGTATALALTAFQSSLQFFVSPSQIAAKQQPLGRTVRLGGLVEAGTVQREVVQGHPRAKFRVTDGRANVMVEYSGVLPDLFREGQGIVALGTVQPDGTFRAAEVLAKHDENYMPKEVVEALKKSGHWNPAGGGPPPAGSWVTMPIQKAAEPSAQPASAAAGVTQ